ncbi:MAG: signal peptidase I [Simkaniaceae bacterium]|nr:signal peptidase I [Simkaniaceae bacterium]
MMTFKKAKEILFKGYLRYEKKKGNLSPLIKEEFKKVLSELQEAIMASKKKEAIELAKQVKKLMQLHLKRNPLEYFKETSLSLGFALFVVILIRQMWFELYEVPTGSMRPTIQEHDRLLVSKSTYGINIPLRLGHFYFDDHLLQRNSVVIFTGEGLDIRNLETKYFYIFPGIKQFVKRLIGKSGDKLYFYGGKIYGINRFNEDISHELNLPELTAIDHIPFISLEGKLVPSQENSLLLCQMNEPVAQLMMSPGQKLRGKLLVKDIEHYYDLWGFKNYAVARLLTQKEYETLASPPYLNGDLILELTHHPDVKTSALLKLPSGGLYPTIGTEKSYIALPQEAEHRLFESLYTARFVVSKGKISRYGREADLYSPSFSLDVPDGIYEFYQGTAFQLGWGGIRHTLAKDHPLYTYSREKLQLLFNLGIAFDTRLSPLSITPFLLPSRFAFWRDQNLYVMGQPFLMKDDPLLQEYMHTEYTRQSAAPKGAPYIPFEDLGPPLKSDGKIDTDFIEKYGVKVPEGHYLVLGDNYADSGDSRDFGFVPQENLRGSPALTFFPPGKNFGPLNQPTTPLVTTPKLIVWGTFLTFFALWQYYNRKKQQLPIHID